MIPLKFIFYIFSSFIVSCLCQRGVREFSYSLDNARLYTKEIGENGPTFVVGSKYYQVVPNTNENTTMICKRRERNDFRTVYKTSIRMKNSTGKTNKLTQALYDKYFAVIVREVWNCATGKIGMIRIMEELVGREEISRILYQDGVEVTSKPLIGNRRTAHIRKIKYFDQIDSKIWRFDGFIKLMRKTVGADEKIPDWVKTYRNEERKKGNEFTEVTYTNPGALQNIFDAQLPIKMELISTIPSEILGVKESIAICKKQQDIGTFLFDYRPKLNITDKTSQKTITITQENYLDYITPIKDELWICKDEKGIQFLRLVQEFFSRTEVGEVKYSEEWVELREVKPLNNKNIRVKSIYYLTYKFPFELMRYSGKIRLESPEDRKLIKVMARSNNAAGVAMREIEYVLEPGHIYRSFIGLKGMNIRVGTAWSRTIGGENDTVNCHLLPKEVDYSFDHGTKFRIRLQSEGKEYMKAIPRSKHYKYWKFVSQEIWTCEKSGAYRFLRIVNELQGLKQLQQVEYYDSIQLYSRTLNVRKTSVNVIEIKYLDHNTFATLKYDGKLKLQNPPERTKNFIDCPNCDGQPIMKTEYEIFLEFGRKRPSFSYNYVENVVASEPNRVNGKLDWESTTWDLENGKILFAFGDLVNTGGRPTIIYDTVQKNGEIMCTLTDETRESFSLFALMTKSGAGSNTYKFQSEEQLAQWGYPISRKVWECREFGKVELKFYRIVNKFRFIHKFRLAFARKGYTLTFIDNRKYLEVEERKLLHATNDRTLDYDGNLHLLEPDMSTVKSDTTIKSGTFIFNYRKYRDSDATEKHSEGQKNIYRLDDGRFHQIKIRDNGRSVEIGQKWPSNSITEPVTCELLEDFPINKFKKYYRTECTYLPKDKANLDSEKTLCFDTYFNLIDWEVWSCKNNKNKILFRRIVNHFELKTWEGTSTLQPIKDIRHYDGVFVGFGKYAHGVDGWTFKQIKYMSVDDSPLIYKYDGKLTLKENIIQARPLNELLDTNTKSCLFNVATRSMSYLIDHDKMAYRTTVKSSGVILKIDSRYEKVASNDTLICKQQPKTEPSYGMRVFLANRAKDFLFEFDKGLSASFMSTLSLSWGCSLLEEGEEGDVKLIRVINRLEVGEDRLAHVIHNDGVTVIKGESVIEELKFIDPSDGKITKYDGSLVFVPGPHEFESIQSPKVNRDMEYILDRKLVHVRKFKELDTAQLFIEFGSQWQKVFADSNHKIQCDLSSNLADDKPKDYLPEVLIPLKNDQLWYFSKMNKTQLESMFKVLTRNAIPCESSQYGNITRIVNTVETNADLAEIYYTDGVTIWKNDTDGAITLREVKYMDPTTKEIVKFDGVVDYVNHKSIDKFAEGTSVEDDRALSPDEYNKHVLVHKSWHKDLEKWQTDRQGNEPLENIAFTPLFKHTTKLQPFVGMSIEIGQKWTKEIGSEDDTFKCKMEDITQYDRKALLPKITIDLGSDKITLDDKTIENYFDIEKPKIYKCSKDSESFLKVVNEVRGKSGVRKVFHQDGVKVLRHSIGLNTLSARIIEQKYLDPTDFNVLKFAGKLVME